MKFFCTFFLLSFGAGIAAQEADSSRNATLQKVVIKAYEQKRLLRDVPAAVGYINRAGLERFGSASIVHAINTLPGVRMEERSPGSYRLNIRGSSLRSPFGIRNVKVYYNDLPITDPGGQTYLNGLGNYNFNSIEIIKGPGSSLYGAGTGGVLLIEGMSANEQPGIGAEYSAGSYGLKNVYASVTTGREEATNKIGFQHQQSDGYRNHSSLRRNIFSWNGRFGNGAKTLLKATFLYSDLFYETPGALTKAEYDLNPRLSRPSGGGFPSAQQAQAAIFQKIFLAGVSYRHQFSATLSNTTSAYGMFTELRNPAIRNYGKNTEPHAGGRTTFSFNKENINIVTGAEFQQNFASVTVYKNKTGTADTLQSLDDIPIRNAIVFLQAGYQLSGWELTAGGSLNYQKVRFKRTSPFPSAVQEKNFNNEFTPRLSLAKKWKIATLYTSISEGFSPPSSNELLPSGSSLNLSLEPEKGTNYDIGLHGKFRDLSIDINAFLFTLQNTLAQRRDAGGGDFYVNAGKTKQTGIESSIAYPFLKSVAGIQQSSVWISHTWHKFSYKDFRQLNSDFSGNALPGVALHTISSGLDLVLTNGLQATISYYFSDRIPLDDANSAYAEPYHLFHAKIGYAKSLKDGWGLRFTIGAENLFDEKYSLGNDINAFGGRYYNAAPRRSFYASLLVQKSTK